MNSATINGKDFASITYPDGKCVLKLVRGVMKDGLFCLEGYSFPFGTTINLNGIPYKINTQFTKKKFQRNGEKYVSWYLNKLEF
jgi:hypothetical protein